MENSSIGGGNMEIAQVAPRSETASAPAGFQNYDIASYAFNAHVYPLTRPYFNKAEHRDLSDAQTVTDLICKFFEGVHGAATRNESDTFPVDEFAAYLLVSDPHIQRLFARTYILKDTSAFDPFTRQVENERSNPFNKEVGLQRKLRFIVGPDNSNVDAGCFNRLESFFTVMSRSLLEHPRTEEFFRNRIQALPKNDAETTSEHISRAIRTALEELFPETKNGGVFPTSINEIADAIAPIATVADVQIVLNQLTDYLEIDAINIPENMNAEEADKALAQFIALNKTDLRGFTHLSILRSDIRMLPVAVKLLGITRLKICNCPNFKIPLWIGDLQSIQRIKFYKDQITYIPESIGALKNLAYLCLSSNNLTGPIPASLGAFGNLRHLNLRNNQLSGPIPNSLEALGKLESLILFDNNLTGPIPASLGRLRNLKALCLARNNLTGSIPFSLGTLRNLENLNLDSNNLTGSIPSSLGALESLTFLNLENNQLTGAIPESIGPLKNLGNLNLGNNQLTGSIPESLRLLGHLGGLNLVNNQFDKPIPGSLGALESITFLSIENLISAGLA